MKKLRTAIVTGGSRGIGRACCLRLAENGFLVGINYRTGRERAQSVLDEITRNGGRAILLPGDVSKEVDVLSIFDAAEKADGNLSVLVNNAGIVAEAKSIVDYDLDRMQSMFATNILGPFLTCREAARRFTSGGAIVNISSIASRLGAPFYYVDYAAAKAAVDTMTLGLAVELAPKKIRVNAIRPGWIDTEIHASGGQPDLAKVAGKNAPLGRSGTAEEVADAVVYLVSEQASYCTGSILDVSGGL